MAGHARYTAVLDACVLYSQALSDALMSLASNGLFAAKWTTTIEDEWIRNLEKQRPDLTGRLTTRRDAMRDAVVDWEISEAAWQALAPSLTLPDPDDVHVLAAAIAGHADCIVTANLKDFPAERVGQFGIEVIHPDDFIVKQLDLDLFTALAAFRGMRTRWRRPNATPEEFAQAMEKNGLVATAERLRQALSLL
jgi:predicted nucleic acid-binding protein